ncbi:uncharacterized protein LOC122254736 [Penaeus japonicus]|uniref:uncharacterized protein LOC122254736 n=1 Tax=Penaeus japonicus TaxID=27405 RepID=UPI001C7169FB|nr:uncharacterized protein LOC122254736 [Penaeus japonicus]
MVNDMTQCDEPRPVATSQPSGSGEQFVRPRPAKAKCSTGHKRHTPPKGRRKDEPVKGRSRYLPPKGCNRHAPPKGCSRHALLKGRKTLKKAKGRDASAPGHDHSTA